MSSPSTFLQGLRSASTPLLGLALAWAFAFVAQADSVDVPTRWVGVVLPLEAVDVAAQTAGRLEQVAVRAGEAVEASALLARIDARNALQEQRIADAELQVAEAELARASARNRQEASRYERRSTSAELWSEEELSSMEVEARSAAADLSAAEARVARARAEVEQWRQVVEQSEIRAPFAGRVAVRYLDSGAIVAPGTEIVRLVSGEALLVRFAVPPEEIGGLRLGARVDVLDTAGERVGQARIQHVAPEIDLASQRIFAEATLDASTLGREIQGGLGVEVRLVAGVPAAGAPAADPPVERVPPEGGGR